MARKPTETTLSQAFTSLCHLIAQGWEYPDAHAKVCDDYGLGHGYYADVLRDRYDMQEGN